MSYGKFDHYRPYTQNVDTKAKNTNNESFIEFNNRSSEKVFNQHDSTNKKHYITEFNSIPIVLWNYTHSLRLSTKQLQF